MIHNAKTIFDRPEEISAYEKLKDEYDSIQKDVHTILSMEISDEAKKLPLEELQKQIDDVKERMHNYINEL